jgi:hypothetical protein
MRRKYPHKLRPGISGCANDTHPMHHNPLLCTGLSGNASVWLFGQQRDKIIIWIKDGPVPVDH